MEREIPLLALKKQTAVLWRGPQAEGGRVPLGAESSHQLAASRETWPSVLPGNEMNSATNQRARKGPPGLSDFVASATP